MARKPKLPKGPTQIVQSTPEPIEVPVDPPVPEPLQAPEQAPKKCNIPPEKIYRGGRKPGAKNKYIKQKEDRGHAHREGALSALREANRTLRDISPLPNDINWERRLACKFDHGLFAKTYIPNTFKLGWSANHERCNKKIEAVVLDGGKFAIAMPRGEGKTALCRSAIIWSTAYAHKLFPFLIASAQPKAEASLDFIKAVWYGSPLLRQDFPEIAFPIAKLENRWHLAKGQVYAKRPTHIDWGSSSIRYPVVLLTEEEAATYMEHDPEFLLHRPAQEADSLGEGARPELWMPKSCGININTAGIDGSIRGEAGVHPELLTQPRPDLVLIDDVQKDNKVDSEISCDKLKILIDGAINFLNGPDGSIAALMPCTVIREGDVADTYVNQDIRPEWHGERCSRVVSWPPGIDDERMTLDTPEGIAWNEYDKLRRKSAKQHGDNRLATEYYKANRELMDNNFVVSWAERFDKKTEISAQQSCMNLRLEVGSAMFMAECQNKGRKPLGEGTVLISRDKLAQKVSSLQRNWAPVNTRNVVIHIDVQNEIFYWLAYAFEPDYTGIFCNYGTFPEAPTPYFKKHRTEEWSLLTRLFFESYPHLRDKAEVSEKYGIRAPFEAKIYHGLQRCIPYLLGLDFRKDDPHGSPLFPARIGIDITQGQAKETIMRFIGDWSRSDAQVDANNQVDRSGWQGRDILVPYRGRGITAEMRQYEEQERTPGWLFEDQVNPTLREVKWIWKPDPAGRYTLNADVNRLKSFLFQRLAAPMGMPGSVCLFNGTPEDHELFCEHICDSEWPEFKGSFTRTLKKEMWVARQGAGRDNDWLDCAAACMALAGFSGSVISHVEPTQPSQSRKGKRRLSEQWRAKQRTE